MSSLQNSVIQQPYDFNKGEEIILYKGKCEIVKDDTSYEGIAKIKFVFLPKAEIVIDTEFQNSIARSFMDKEDELDFFINEQKIDAFVISDDPDPNTHSSKLRWVLKKSDIPLVIDPKKTRYIIFHIFNFYHFKDSYKTVPYNNGTYHISEIVLETQNYFITIQSFPKTKENIEEIKKKGISRLTQVARVEKKDAEAISIEEYTKLQKLLTCFFSFTKGSWINPSFSIGMDDSGEQKWYLLHEPQSEWKSLDSWFKPTSDQLGMSTMKELFSLFATLWEVDDWQETLWEVIYWFISANDGVRGIEPGLILAQTALERLSFEYVVNDKKLLSSKGFKDIRASDKLRLLFSSLTIPVQIPNELKTLTDEAKHHNWCDAPHALTEIRNSLVHPEHKKHGKLSGYIYLEAYTLSLWYLEISILAICKFDGVYANRVKNCHVENVPYKS